MVSLSSCNLYGGIDSPSGDAQILSAARAAFDQGDLTTALNYYKQLSSSSSDVQLAEEAELSLKQAGADISKFAGAFGSGTNIAVGPAVATFAYSMMGSIGVANRTLIYNAFQNYKSIRDPNLSALVHFITSMAMAGLVLAEDIPAGSPKYSAAIVCPPTGTPACVPSGTNIPAGSAVTGGNLNGATLSDYTATQATLSMFNGAMIDVLNAVNAIGPSGSFGTSTQSLASTLTAGAPSVIGAANYRSVMVQTGVAIYQP